MLWVHKCSGITKRLVADSNSVCLRCKNESQPIDGRTVTEVDVDGTMLDVEAISCYLCDMLCSSGSCDSAIAVRCCVAWGDFRELLPVLTTRYLSPGPTFTDMYTHVHSIRTCNWGTSGSCLNIKMSSCQYRDSHVKDKTVSSTVLSLTWESPYLGKMVFILRRGPGYIVGISPLWLTDESRPAKVLGTSKHKFDAMQ